MKKLLILLVLLAGAAWGQPPVKIEFWHAMRGQRSQFLERLAERFQKENPGVQVTSRLIVNANGPRLGNDYEHLYRSLLEAIARGNPPTLAQVYENWTTQLIDVDALTPVDSFFAASGWNDRELADFVPVFLDANRFKGRLWTLPFNKSVYVLFYNKAVFARLGLTPPRTWAELRQDAQKISHDARMPGIAFQPGVDTFGQYLIGNGGTFLSTNKADFGGALGQQDMAYWVDLVHTDRSAFPTLKAVEIFAQGGAGMLIETTSKVPRMEQETGLEFGVAPLPGGSQFAGTNLAVFAKASPEQQKAAWKFTQFLTSPEVTREWSQESGYLPVRLSAQQSPAYQEFLKTHPANQEGLAALQHAVSQPRVAGWESIRGLIDDAMFEALSRKATPQEALKRAVSLTDDLLAKLQGAP